MAISESLGMLYSKAEDRFFGLMDFLEEKGLPVYAVINPLEEKGVPVFPITIALLIALGVFLYGFLFVGVPDVIVKMDIRDEYGNELSNVSIEIKDAAGNKIPLEDDTVKNTQNIVLHGIPIGTELTIFASKEGYLNYETPLRINGTTNTAVLELQRDIEIIVGKLRLVDADTGDLVRDVEVSVVLLDGSTVSCYVNADGEFECPGVVEGDPVTIFVSSSNYDDSHFFHTFFGDSVNELLLMPRPDAMEGSSNLIIRAKDADTLEMLGNVTIKIYDAATDELISEVTDDDGDYTETIAKGTSVRIVVERENYAMYDSSADGYVRTMRDEEELWEVFLFAGGRSIAIGVIDVSGTPLTGATVTLYNSNSEFIESKETGFAGQVEFENLDPTSTYYVTAYLDRYLSNRVAVVPLQQQTVNIELERATAANSASLEVTVAHLSDSTVANDATLNFYEVVDDAILPLGIPQAKTSLSGSYSTTAPLEKEVLVRAVKGVEEGEESIIIEPGTNELLIYIERPVGVVLLRLVDEAGNPINEGRVIVESGSGELIVDDNVTDGEVWINAGDNKYVELTYISPDGREFTEEISIGGEYEVEVEIILGEVPGLAPSIEFKGIFNLQGEEVQGINLGEDYYAKFEIVFPEGSGGGVHIRVGKDSERYADSQDIGIVGFTAIGADHFYGRTYSPTPEPGYEGIDFQNEGSPGEYNKWLELYFDEGGTKIVKARIKAKETALGNDFELHYRAWTEVGGSYYRTPEDSILGLEEYTDQRSGLYAEAEVETIKLFEGSAECENELCASYKFIRADGSEYDVENFRAVKDERYALQVELNPSKDIVATVKASTSHTAPKLYFTGYGINNFSEFPDNNKTDTSIEVTGISVPEDTSVIVRLYFRTAELENASITLQLITDETVLNETFYFNIYFEKNMAAKTEPEAISIGQDFTIIVEDESDLAVENATIKLKDSAGRILETIFGDGGRGNGLNGRYDVDNTFDPGTITMEVTAEGYKPFEAEIVISKTGILQIPSTIEVIIPAGEESADTKVSIENSSDEMVQDITFEINRKSNWPAGMDLSINPISYIDKHSSQYAVFVGMYEGDEEREHAEAEIIVRGEIVGKYPVTATTNVVVKYNPELTECIDNDETVECLEFSKERLVVYLLGDQGSTQEVFFTIKNYSNLELTLTPEIVARGRTDEEIKVEVNEVHLLPKGTESAGTRQDSQEVTIYVSNELARNYPGKRTFKYDIFFKSDSITKSIPLEVIVWDKRFALQVMRNIELWLAETEPGMQPQARVPLYVRNVGEADIENLRFTIASGMQRGNVDIKIEPSIAIQTLKKGQSLMPPLWVVATGLRTARATLHDVKQISVKGVIDGREVDFGPIYITSHVSPPQCLLVIPNEVSFQSARSTEGAISKQIIIRNNCAEEVRIVGIDTPPLGSNELTLSPTDIHIVPGAEGQAHLILTKREGWTGPVQPAFIKAFLLRSQRWTNSQPINLDIKLGKDAVDSKVATDMFEIEVCSDAERKEKKPVRFPKIALTANCDNAYCDAEQLATYLVERIELKVKDAKRQVQHYNAEILNTNCDPTKTTYCSFDRLGVKTEEFDVYFMNDNLSADLLQDVAEKKSSELGAYKVDFVAPGTAAGELLGGYGNRIFMNDLIQGCGRYRVMITGAVRVQGTMLLPDYIDVVVDLQREDTEEGLAEVRELTEQCQPKIQNVMNFLPVDKSYSPGISYDSWLGVVTTDEEQFKELGEDFAKSLFDSEDRFVTTSYGTSELVMRLGTVEGYIVKIDIEATSEGNPATIYANIMEASGREQQEVAKEAVKAIKELRENVIDGCISPNEDYFLIKSAKEVGKIEIEVPREKLSLIHSKPNCLDFNIAGDISEEVEVKARLKEERQGTTEPWIEHNNSRVSEVKLENKDEKRNKYVERLQICIEGQKDMQLAQGKHIIISAESKANKQKRDEKEVTMQICGIHPYDLMTELRKVDVPIGGEKVRYATLVWAGPNDEVLVRYINKFELAKAYVEEADKIIKGEGIKMPGQRKFEEDLRRRTMWGINTYGLACGAACMGCSVPKRVLTLGLGFVGGAINCAIDCGIPWLTAMGKNYGWWDGFGGMMKNLWDEFANFFRYDERGGIGSGVSPAPITDSRLPDKLEGGGTGIYSQHNDEIRKTIIETAVGSVAVGSARLGYVNVGNTINTVSAGYYADKVADEYMKHLGDTIFDAGETAARKKFIKNNKKLLSDRIKQQLLRNPGADISSPEQLKTVLSNASNKALDDIATKGIDFTGLRNISKSTKSEIDSIRKNLVSGATKEIRESASMKAFSGQKDIEIGRLFKVDAAGASTTNLSAEATAIIDDISDKMAKDVVDELVSKPGILTDTTREAIERNPALKQQLVNELSTEYKSSLGNIAKSGKAQLAEKGYTGSITTKIPREAVDNISGSAMDSALKRVNVTVAGETVNIADDLADSFQNRATGQLVKKLEQEAGQELLDKGAKVKWKRIRSFFGGLKTWTFWKSVLKGLGCGAVGQVAGGAGWRLYWKHWDKGPAGPDAVIDARRPVAQDMDEPDQMLPPSVRLRDLKRYETYMITLSNSEGVVRYSIDHVNDIESIPDDANWLQMCDSENLKQGTEKFLPVLVPDPSEFDEHKREFPHEVEYIKKYYETHGAIIAKVLDAGNYAVPDALLVTVAAVTSFQDNYITGCKAGKISYRNADASFSCAAKALEGFIKECNGIDSDTNVKCVLREYYTEYPVEGGISKKELDLLVKRYNLWNKSKFLETEDAS